MSSTEANEAVVLAFIERFCAGDVAARRPLLAENLRFRGPLLRADSRERYLDALREAPPEPCDQRIVNVAATADTVSVFYEYRKRDATLRIAQLCTLARGRITEMLPIFDTATLV